MDRTDLKRWLIKDFNRDHKYELDKIRLKWLTTKIQISSKKIDEPRNGKVFDEYLEQEKERIYSQLLKLCDEDENSLLFKKSYLYVFEKH